MLGGRHGISLHLDSLTSSPLPAAGRIASFSRVEVAVQNTPYRLDGSTERPETLLLFFFVRDTGWHLPQLLVRECGQPVTQFTLVSLDWDLGWWLGAGIFGRRGVWKRIYPWESGKEQKTDTFCCTQGSWSQDRFCDQALDSSTFEKRNDARGRRLELSLLYISGSRQWTL